MADDVRELLVLWVRLGDALPADTAGPSAGSSGRSATSTAPRSVTNETVLDARRTIEVQADELGTQVMRILSLTRRRGWDLPTVAGQLDSWHRRLSANPAATSTAQTLPQQAASWLHLARAAVGLSVPGHDLEQYCPLHPNRPTGLRVDGDQATLAAEILSGRWPAASAAKLTWRHGQAVHCPHCRARWSGPAALVVLGNLIDEAGPAAPPAMPDGWVRFGRAVDAGAGDRALMAGFGMTEVEVRAARGRHNAAGALRRGVSIRSVMAHYRLDYAETIAIRDEQPTRRPQ